MSMDSPISLENLTRFKEKMKALVKLKTIKLNNTDVEPVNGVVNLVPPINTVTINGDNTIDSSGYSNISLKPYDKSFDKRIIEYLSNQTGGSCLRLSVIPAINLNVPYEFYHGDIVVYNNEIHLLGGGTDSNRKNHYKWNGSSWVSVSTLPYDFYNSKAVVYNNEIHIFGGGVNNTDTVNGKKHYAWNGYSWISKSTMPINFRNGVAIVYNNEINIISGSSHYIWDGSAWTKKGNTYSSYDYDGATAVIYNNAIHMMGGYTNPRAHVKWNGTKWSNVKTLAYYAYGSKAVVYNNEIHLLGAQNAANVYHYRYNGSAWASVDTLPFGFYNGAAVVYNDKIYIIGGEDNPLSNYMWDGTTWIGSRPETLEEEYVSISNSNGSQKVIKIRLRQNQNLIMDRDDIKLGYINGMVMPSAIDGGYKINQTGFYYLFFNNETATWKLT